MAFNGFIIPELLAIPFLGLKDFRLPFFLAFNKLLTSFSG